MNIVFVSMALNIHQIGVSDELYRLTGGKFCFIETGYGTKGVQKGGESEFASRSFLIKVKNSSTSQKSVALQIIRDADMMIFGAAPIEYLKERVKTGKLTFVYSERWFKRGILNLLFTTFITATVVLSYPLSRKTCICVMRKCIRCG